MAAICPGGGELTHQLTILQPRGIDCVAVYLYVALFQQIALKKKEQNHIDTQHNKL